MSLELRDSRRLTGPSLLWAEPGAAIEVAGPDGPLQEAIERWFEHAERLQRRFGWDAGRLASRSYPHGASLALAAPVDVLYAACEVAEAAWEAARSGFALDGETLGRLQTVIDAEARPRMLQLRRYALELGVQFLWDDDTVSLGCGAGAIVRGMDALPDPKELAGSALSDVPIALVTGTNGKTTTVRMLAAIAAAAGRTPGNTSTDGVEIAGATVLEGDYTGPEGARAVLRDPRVEAAFLETARGGMLRRGLPVFRAEVAAVTNVGTDHLGEWGIDDLEDLAAVKAIVARAVEPDGWLVLNRDDAHVVAAAAPYRARRAWVTLEPGLDDGRDGPVYRLRSGKLERISSSAAPETLLAAGEIPACFDGAALHNVQNALTAWAIADRLALPDEATRTALRAFGSDPADNPGRANLYRFGGLRVLVDFGHNPEGLERVLDLARRLDPRRWLVILGQAGDRRDDAIAEMARIAGAAGPDRIVLKQMRKYLRGRPAGEVTACLHAGLDAAGYPAERREQAPDELAAVRRALEWGRDGDVLLLLLHADREAVARLLDRLSHDAWKPGTSLPEEHPK